ncbi:hypothetical protein PP178_06410 [Zeaxanthinibacter sp. PT1]|uniref:hypothetical protein n=1 Tax=Zeaxanthinibacter TaxID=561554 RepID=UPI00234948A4|nr:hypothetical protein [Zeaxanthinibacter sp. PT1]MDC6351181.1 hypothetical protein [Zeaxanthinibacter sp. PT1]
MFSKQNLLATLAGFLVTFLLGYLIWGFATVDFYAEHTLADVSKDPMNIGLIALANLIAAFALSTIYGTYAHAAPSAGSGFKFGAWIGVFTGFGLGLLWFATTEIMDMTGTIVEAIINIVFYGIVGAVIGLVYQKTAPKAA